MALSLPTAVRRLSCGQHLNTIFRRRSLSAIRGLPRYFKNALVRANYTNLQNAAGFSVKTVVHIHRLFERFGCDEVFGRGAVVELLKLQNSSASKLLSKLVQAEIIEPVQGYGKGRYRFKQD